LPSIVGSFGLHALSIAEFIPLFEVAALHVTHAPAVRLKINRGGNADQGSS
jgi:hypothetical protein